MLFLDAVRGAALVSMVVNHTARFWMGGPMRWSRYHLIYVTLTLSAPIFLFLVGFCLPLSLARATADRRARWLALAWKYTRRGGMVILGGFALNIVVFPEDPWWVGGVLQTIGLSIVLLGPVASLSLSRTARFPVLAVAVAMYVAFSLSQARVADWVSAHPLIGQIWFFDFAPWPWISLVLVGLVLGGLWVETMRRPEGVSSRYFAVLGGTGVACVLAFLAYDWWMGTPLRFGLKRDFILNQHWIPRGVTTLWVFGTLFVVLASGYYLMEVKGYRAPWLVTLGQTALMLYFVHQVIVVTLAQRLFGVSFQSWWWFWVANALLMVLLVYLGKLWLEVKQFTRRGRWRLGRAATPSAQIAEGGRPHKEGPIDA
jgi:uncharacterized membrane protein